MRHARVLANWIDSSSWIDSLEYSLGHVPPTEPLVSCRWRCAEGPPPQPLLGCQGVPGYQGNGALTPDPNTHTYANTYVGTPSHPCLCAAGRAALKGCCKPIPAAARSLASAPLCA